MDLSYQNFNRDSQKSYQVGLIVLAISYFLFEMIFIPQAGFVRDEFWFGHHVYQYLHHIPYRDFLPYKPVLGYYLLTLPLWFSDALLTPMYLIKGEIALINTLFILITGYWARQFFSTKAIFFTLLIIIASQRFLIISSDLRVDMLSSWLGLISILFILSQRYLLAGIILALGFLVSQKVLWFFAASNIAFVIYWLTISRNSKTFLSIILFNTAVIVPIAIYIASWAHYSSLSTVINSVFLEGFIQSKITWYRQIYYECWRSILLSGSIFILLWPLTWISLLVTTKNPIVNKRRVFIALYSAVVLLEIISYQQAFLYNMVFCVPAFFLLYADFLTWLSTLFEYPSKIKTALSTRELFWLLSSYAILVTGVLLAFGLNNAYLQLLIIPLCLGLLIRQPQSQYRSIYQACIMLTLLFTGVFYPLVNTGLNAYIAALYGSYQRANLKVADAILNEGGEYFAGTPVFYKREQAVPGLMNLIGPAVDYLYKPSPDLLPILLPSLYLTPRTHEQILTDLKNKPIKLYINNNRIDALPSPLNKYLFTHYEHFWGSIYLYAPFQLAGDRQFSLKFDGNYRIETSPSASIEIDNKIVRSGDKVHLSAGNHLSKSNQSFRLKYLPANEKLKLNPKYQSYAVEMLASV